MPRATGRAPRSILQALSLPLDGSGTSFESLHGGSGFAQTGHLKASAPDKDGSGTGLEKHYFVKISSSTRTSSSGSDPLPDEGAMFRGEYISLNAISGAVPNLCPRAIAWGEIKDFDHEFEEIPSTSKANGSNWFLVTEFLQLGGSAGRRPASNSTSLAVRLGKLHSTPAPPPPSVEEVEQASMSDFKLNGAEGKGGDRVPQFGFPVPTFCGNVKQPNKFRRSWADFYANQRLRTVLEESERRNGQDKGLRDLVERTAKEVVPRLLGDGHLGFDKQGNGKPIVPVIVHGDLWSGNADVGKICRVSQEQDEEAAGDVVYDPSSCYAHSEFELGIMKMFGGFGGQFYKEYHRIVPKTEPEDEYEDRIDLYELSVDNVLLFPL
ncbi:putative protein-ribulosamine 3-kinase [Microsporum canis]|uniref:protein-ribulosamine 3-kinase n=1 Tax=Arthroderma otae (strain ATCC MYA-4605 / CBS 113480) TaxID=554155 RepID=C5FRN5_ARTOC|nr:phosphotransferase family protein [Microsporum canis CBS 113480]EEQ32538.1 phosphotransferase family protein [Microsporum canis CBS 113480]